MPSICLPICVSRNERRRAGRSFSGDRQVAADGAHDPALQVQGVGFTSLTRGIDHAVGQGEQVMGHGGHVIEHPWCIGQLQGLDQGLMNDLGHSLMALLQRQPSFLEIDDPGQFRPAQLVGHRGLDHGADALQGVGEIASRLDVVQQLRRLSLDQGHGQGITIGKVLIQRPDADPRPLRHTMSVAVLSVFMLVKTTPEWLGFSVEERFHLMRTQMEPILQKHSAEVSMRFFDIEFYSARVTDLWWWEASSHHAYELLVEELRETPFWDRYFKVVEILPGVENAYAKNYGQRPLLAS